MIFLSQLAGGHLPGVKWRVLTNSSGILAADKYSSGDGNRLSVFV